MAETCLLFYSGGKDSFITACKQAERGYSVVLLSFNNGALVCEANLYNTVQRLKKRYGSRIEFAGVYLTSGIFQDLRRMYFSRSLAELSGKYPSLQLSQMQCLVCQVSMWVAGIAYAKAHNIKRICAGYKLSDEFCTGDPAWVAKIKQLAASFDVLVDTPVWNDDEWLRDPMARDDEMARRGFNPSVLEPKCMLGLPARELSATESMDLISFYEDELYGKLEKLIERIVPMMKYYTYDGKSIR